MSFSLSPALPREITTTTAMRVDVRTIEGRDEWDHLVAASPFPHLPQTFAYGEGKRAKGWTVSRALFEQAERTIAYAVVLERRVFGIRVLARINRGPVFLEASPRPDRVTAVYAALRRRWRGPLLIAPALEADATSSAILQAAGFKLRHGRGWLSGRINLRPDEEHIWGGFSSNFRNRYRQSLKGGAVLRVSGDVDTFEWMLDRHLENMRTKQFRGANATFLRAMRDVAPENVLVFQLIDGGQPIAGMSVVCFGSHAEYHIGWFGAEGRKLNAGNFLMWEIIKELKRRGVTDLDIGGMRAGDGYTRFKRTMRPVEFNLVGEWMSI